MDSMDLPIYLALAKVKLKSQMTRTLNCHYPSACMKKRNITDACLSIMVKIYEYRKKITSAPIKNQSDSYIVNRY